MGAKAGLYFLPLKYKNRWCFYISGHQKWASILIWWYLFFKSCVDKISYILEFILQKFYKVDWTSW